jgi:hypothetical protein
MNRAKALEIFFSKMGINVPILFSSRTGEGRKELWNKITEILKISKTHS